MHHTFVPTISFRHDYLMNLVAIFGTTISPYVMFWQADAEVEKDVAQQRVSASGKGTPQIMPEDIREIRIDVWSGMIFANIVSFFIILTAPLRWVLMESETCKRLARLRGYLGRLPGVLHRWFHLGIVCTGLLAVPVLAGSASYAVAGALDWRSGLVPSSRSGARLLRSNDRLYFPWC